MRMRMRMRVRVRVMVMSMMLFMMILMLMLLMLMLILMLIPDTSFKSNTGPENRLSQKEGSLPTTISQVPYYFYRVYCS